MNFSRVDSFVPFVLGDRHYNTLELLENCDQADLLLVTSKYRCYPRIDDGVEARRLFHQLHCMAFEHGLPLFIGLKAFLRTYPIFAR